MVIVYSSLIKRFFNYLHIYLFVYHNGNMLHYNESLFFLIYRQCVFCTYLVVYFKNLRLVFLGLGFLRSWGRNKVNVFEDLFVLILTSFV